MTPSEPVAVPLGVARRTSPWTVGLELAGFALVAPAAALAILAGSIEGALQAGAFAVVLAYRAVAWRFRTYTLTDVHLELDEGILQRRHRSVPYARVQQVDIHESLVHRLVDVAALRIETAGEGGATAVALRVVRRRDAEALRSFVLARRGRGAAVAAAGSPETPAVPTHLVGLSPKQVFLAGATELSFVLVGIALLPVSVALLVAGAASGSGVVAAVGAISLLLPGLAIFLALTAGIAALLQDWDYILQSEGDDLHVRRGLLQVRQQTIPRSRVQHVTVLDNPLRRALGIASVVFHSAAGSAQEQGQRNSLRIPLVRGDDAAAMLVAVLGPTWAPPALRPRDATARRRAVRRRTLLLLVLFVPTLVLTPVALLGIPWGRAAHRRAGHGETPTVAAFASGVLHHRLDLVPRARIQSARTSASPLQRRVGLRTVWIDVAGATAAGPLTRSPHLHDLADAVAGDAMRALHLR